MLVVLGVGCDGVVGCCGCGGGRDSASMVVVVIMVVVSVVVVTVVVGVLNIAKHANVWFAALGYHKPVGGGDGAGSGCVVCGCDVGSGCLGRVVVVVVAMAVVRVAVLSVLKHILSVWWWCCRL